MKRQTLHPLALLSAVMVIGSSICQAQQTIATVDIPKQISYQGLLTSNSGAVMPDGSYQLTVTLYSDAQGTNKVWQDTYSTMVKGGQFNVYLGGGTVALPPSDAISTPLWIGLKVNGTEELRPLTPLSASPYALNVANNSVTSSKITNGAITAEKISADYVSGIRVNGEKVTGNGTELNITGSSDVKLTYDKVTNTIVIGSADASRDETSEKGKGKHVMDAQVGSNWTGANAGPNVLTFVSVATTANGTLAGGTGNSIYGLTNGATITGGRNNEIDTLSAVSTIGGGKLNRIHYRADSSTISGGNQNEIGGNSDGSVIAGGDRNTIDTLTDYSVISGGRLNLVSAWHSSDSASYYDVIGGGLSNSITASYSVIGGGQSNTINYTAGANDANSTIGGGVSNTILTRHGMIGGGDHNTLDSNADQGFIGGGYLNTVASQYGIIDGGTSNTIHSVAEFATINGGSDHEILNGGKRSAILNGKQLIAQSYGQAVMGFYNIAKGARTTEDNTVNEPMVIVGNGTATNARSNAFEVSYNGHTTVFGQNGATRPSLPGATFNDNIIYAWGDVSSAINPNDPKTTQLVVNCSFGIGIFQPLVPTVPLSVRRVGTGHYRVYLNMLDPNTGLQPNLGCSSITATISTDAIPSSEDNFDCRTIKTSRMGVDPLDSTAINCFDVYISNSVCQPVDAAFMFKVTGRP